MAIEYLTGLNAIVMKAIWNIEKRQGRVTIQDLVEEIKRNTGKEYHRNSVSTYLRRLEKKDFIETKKEGRRSFICSKVDESDYHKVRQVHPQLFQRSQQVKLSQPISMNIWDIIMKSQQMLRFQNLS